MAQLREGSVIKKSTGDEIIATTTYVDTGLELKADKSQVLTNVPLEAVFTDTVYDDSDNLFIDTTVETVPPQTTVVDADTLGGRPAAEYAKASMLAIKADKASVETKADRTELNAKADQSYAETKASKTYVDFKVRTDVPLNAKFTDTIVDISGKADITYVNNKVKTDVPLNAKFTDTIATKSSVGLSNVDNVKQMPIVGGTFTGVVTAQNNAAHTTKQVRNIIYSTEEPTALDGDIGDLWVVYE